MAKRRALARGLDALLSANVGVEAEREAGQLRSVPIDLIERGKYQPRLRMDEQALEELSRSIQAQGIIQPIVLRALEGSGRDEGRYEIIAGERRWRAAQAAGLDEVPAVVREASDDEALALALIENIQREDLNPIEEAQALARFVDEFGLTHQAAAEAVGRSRVSVTNLLRLLELDAEVRGLMERGELEMGHGRAMLGLDPAAQRQLALEVLTRGLSVRQTEAQVRERRDAPRRTKPLKTPAPDPDVDRLSRELSERIGAAVAIQYDAKGKGRLTIRFNSLDEFEGILDRLK